MKIVSRLLSHFGYVRLKDYGYELSPSGRIVEVVKVEDDRFAPPPWQPVGWQDATSLLPPAPARPPEPRPLAPPPDAEVAGAEPQPLFKVPGAPATVETAPPGPAAGADEAISIDEAPEEEEWEWKMALARARETAEKEKKGKGKAERMAARRGESPSFQTSALPLAPPRTTKVVDSPKPMAVTVQPARERAGGARPEPRTPIARPEPRVPIARVEARAVTAPPEAHRVSPFDQASRSRGDRSVGEAIKNPRTVPPKAPPPGKSKPLPSVISRPPAGESKSPARSSLEKSVSRVFSPPTPSAAGKARPAPRMARGTEIPEPGSGARPIRPQLALGSGQLRAMRDPSEDVTATDITAVDRAQASMRGDEDTRVNVVVAPSTDITLDVAFDPEAEVENTMVDGKPNGVAIVAVEGSPLPRLTARLRRQSVPN